MNVQKNPCRGRKVEREDPKERLTMTNAHTNKAATGIRPGDQTQTAAELETEWKKQQKYI